MRRLASVVALCAACAAGPAGSAWAAEGFVDTFDTFDRERWYVSDGWTNGDHQNCEWSRGEFAVTGGRARLTFAARKTESRAHACAEIQTRKRFGHGTYEARLRTPAGSGLNAAFFTYIGPPADVPHDEIDFEFLLKDTSLLQLNAHVAGVGGNEHMVDLSAPADGAFHDYAFVWEPERIAFFVDGRLVHTIDDPAKVPTRAAKIFFSLWGTDTLTAWMGPFRSPERPLVMEIERVSFTPLGETCPPDASVCGARP